ncbi:MAG: hypothetical protein FKGGLIKP_00199 [Sodalis sp. Fse]|nr:MAG: hypothetical protein FKGGLIKP_00199 [Sodalis sp. Fse]
MFLGSYQTKVNTLLPAIPPKRLIRAQGIACLIKNFSLMIVYAYVLAYTIHHARSSATYLSTFVGRSSRCLIAPLNSPHFL